MKIKSSIEKNVSTAVSNCREVLVTETIKLLKQIGAEQRQDVLFRKMLFLYRTSGNFVETVVCDRIAYVELTGSQPFYLVSMGDDRYHPYRSDQYMSLSDLQAVYKEVRRVVSEY